MTPNEVEAALTKAAATLLLGAAATLAQRQEAAKVIAWLEWIENPRQRRATALRIIPRRDTGAPLKWTEIARMVRAHRLTVRAMHLQNLKLISERLEKAAADA